VCPSSTVMAPIVPSLGAGTSTVILSVMISTTGSSLRTVSPAFLSHFEIVPSAMLSPSCGTTMLTGTLSSCSKRETALAARPRSLEFGPLLFRVEPERRHGSGTSVTVDGHEREIGGARVAADGAVQILARDFDGDFHRRGGRERDLGLENRE